MYTKTDLLEVEQFCNLSFKMYELKFFVFGITCTNKSNTTSEKKKGFMVTLILSKRRPTRNYEDILFLMM